MIVKFAQVCLRKEFEPSVQSGLSITPAQMADLSAKGIPVSAQSGAMEFDSVAVPANDYGVPIDMQRGTDIADVWNAQKNARKKMKEVRKTGVVEPKND